MKKLAFFILLLLSYSNLLPAQAPNWLWAQSAGASYINSGESVATDLNGNVFMTGYFNGPNITLGGVTLANVDSEDVFIVKYDASGNVLWAKSAGNTSDDMGYSVATDLNGNVFMTGYFGGPSITFGTITLTSVGSQDIFIVKYDPNGNVLWAKSAGGTINEIGFGLSTDAIGNVFVTGNYTSPTITFGTITLAGTGSINNNLFIAKYDSNGNVLWAKSVGGSFNEYCRGMTTDANGNAIIVGFFFSSSITFGTITLTNNGSTNYCNMFIVKYDTNGNVLWAKSEGGTDYDYAFGVSADANGNIFMTGSFIGSITFGTTNLTSVFNSFFIVKYDASGNVLWAKGVSSYDNEGKSVSTDASGNVFVTGNYGFSSITFGTTTISGTVNGSGYDIFIVKYDPSGNVLWVKGVSGISTELARGIAVNGNGDVYLTGQFASSTINIGSITLTKYLTSYYDIFIAKLDANPVGLEEHSTYSEISIAPNPFSLQTTLTFKEEQKNALIKILDVLGKEIFSTTFSGKQLVIEKGEMKPGIYFVQSIDEKKTVTNKKIIVQ